MSDEKKAPAAITQRRSPLDEMMLKVETRRPGIEKALPAWLRTQPDAVDRFVFQVRMALAKNPKLQECEPATVVEAVLGAAELGLNPSGALGSAYLVPYGKQCQLIPGYRGLIDLAVRTGDVAGIQPFLVREKDSFRWAAGEIPKHSPWLPRPDEDQDPGKLWLGWSLLTMTKAAGGARLANVMSLKELLAIRARSPSVRFNKTNSPWFTDPDEMFKKTLIRRHLKLAPLSPVKASLLHRAMEIDPDDEEKLLPPEDAPQEEKRPTGNSALKDRLGVNGQQPPIEDAQVVTPDDLDENDLPRKK